MSIFDENDREAKPVTLSVGIIIETQSGGIVMVRQTKNDQWGLIAGRLKNELFDQGIIRELEKEGDFNLRELEEIERWDVPYVVGDDKDKVGVVYRAKSRITDEQINSKKPKDPAIAEIKVFSLEEIISLIYFNQEKIYKPEYNLRNLIRWVVIRIQEDKIDPRVKLSLKS